MPGRAAYLDGRGGSSMRLNFSGVGEDDLREGVRRIGKVVSEQVRLYSTLTGDRAGRPAARGAAPGEPDADGPGARIVPLRRRRRRAMSRVAVLAGGQSLERQVSLRSGARVRDALERLGHEVIAIDVGPGSRRAARGDAGPTWPSSRCTDATARTGRCRRSSSSSASRTPRRARPPACAAWTRCWPSTPSATPGCPTPDFYAFSQTAFESLGAAHALPAIEERLDFPVVVKPAAQGSALGIRFAPTAADVPAAIVAAFSYDTKVLLERHVAGRELAVSVLDGPDGPEALPVVEAIPRGGDHYDFEARYEIGRTDFVCPAELDEDMTQRAQELALDAYRVLGCYGFARVDLMLDVADAASSPCSRRTRSRA